MDTDTYLLILVIAIAVIRWIYVRQRFSEMSARIDALSRIVAQSQARPITAPAPARPAAPPPPPPKPEAPPVAPAVTPPPPKPEAQPAAQVVPPPLPVAPPVVEPVPHFAPPSLASWIQTPEGQWTWGSQPAASVAVPPAPSTVTPTPPVEAPAPAFEPPTPSPQLPTPAVAPRRSFADWEALVGGNLFNKLGILLIVIALAVLLGYAVKYMGPGGRVAIALGASFAMLIAGWVVEKREAYRMFAQGLLGGGWAALYATVYAMQALPVAKVINDPLTGAILLLAVATGMIVHSLRYRSQTVTGLAYFIAFVTLAISPSTPLSVIAVVPLAASLLYVARRFEWRNFALFGLVATYAICASRGDTGAPLWQAQAIFTVYWLLFETFDVLLPHRALLPLNAVGFLGLSLFKWFKWYNGAPEHIWSLLAATAAAYLVGAILRARQDNWRPPITLTAALAAAAIFLKLDYQWVALALLVEAELFYLAGIRLRAPYLRDLAGTLFGIELGHLIVRTLPDVPARAWTPVAVLNVAVFYANRALRSADTYYGYAAAFMMALIAGFDAPHGDRGLAWMVLAAGPFLVGWRWRLVDFRLQAYGLAAIGPIGMAVNWPEPSLSMGIGAALAYGGALCALKSDKDRFTEEEQDALRTTASLFTSGLLAALVWHLVPLQYLGLAWMALAVVLLELGMRRLPMEFRWQSYAMAFAGVAVIVYENIRTITNVGPWVPRLIPAGAALLAYAIAARARKEEGGQVLDFGSFIATGFLLTGLWAVLPPVAVGPAWAVVALVLMEFDLPVLTLQCHLVSIAAFARLFFANFDEAKRLITALTVLPVLVSHYYLWSRTHKRFYLYTAAVLAAALPLFEMDRVFAATAWAALMVGYLYAGRRWKLQDLCWQSYALAVMAFATCWGANFYSPQMFAGIGRPVLVGATVIGCLYAAQLLSDLDGRPRLFYSLLATSLLAVLLYDQVSGNMLTVAWGIEGIALLAAGFPLRDRVLRLSGMALLMFCIFKLFLFDLRNLETLWRILSFMALGLILVAVSWVYTRFKDVLVGPVLAPPHKSDTKPEVV
jgi:uncharacterized membrane protein